MKNYRMINLEPRRKASQKKVPTNRGSKTKKALKENSLEKLPSKVDLKIDANFHADPNTIKETMS